MYRLTLRLLEQHYVTYLKQYIEDLLGKWSRMQQAEGGGGDLDRSTFGSALAVEVLDMFLGPNRAAGRNSEDCDTAVEPQWLKLKRAAVLVARALDLFTAPECITAADRVRQGNLVWARIRVSLFSF